MIVNPHGGPQGIRDRWGFNPEAQLFASRGYGTLHVNFRISGGYGKAFLKAGYGQIGRKAMDDVEDGIAYVIEQGWVDPDSVAIYGGSHGGYAVLRGMTKTPDLYACGVDYVGVSNLHTFMETIPPYWEKIVSYFIKFGIIRIFQKKKSLWMRFLQHYMLIKSKNLYLLFKVLMTLELILMKRIKSLIL